MSGDKLPPKYVWSGHIHWAHLSVEHTLLFLAFTGFRSRHLPTLIDQIVNNLTMLMRDVTEKICDVNFGVAHELAVREE